MKLNKSQVLLLFPLKCVSVYASRSVLTFDNNNRHNKMSLRARKRTTVLPKHDIKRTLNFSPSRPTGMWCVSSFINSLHLEVNWISRVHSEVIWSIAAFRFRVKMDHIYKLRIHSGNARKNGVNDAINAERWRNNKTSFVARARPWRSASVFAAGQGRVPRVVKALLVAGEFRTFSHPPCACVMYMYTKRV